MRMFKFYKRHRSHKGGFTLSEVILALGIFCIFALVVAETYQIVYKLRMNTENTNTQMNTQATILDNGGGAVVYNDTETFSITFKDVDDTITASGEKVASDDAKNYRIPIRVFN